MKSVPASRYNAGTPIFAQQTELDSTQGSEDYPIPGLYDFVGARYELHGGEADVGIENAEEYLAKAELARHIIGALDARRLTQTEAATVLGVSQPKISALRNGPLDGFSAERLIRYLNTLGRDVRITVSVKPRSRRRARFTVRAA